MWAAENVCYLNMNTMGISGYQGRPGNTEYAVEVKTWLGGYSVFFAALFPYTVGGALNVASPVLGTGIIIIGSRISRRIQQCPPPVRRGLKIVNAPVAVK